MFNNNILSEKELELMNNKKIDLNDLQFHKLDNNNSIAFVNSRFIQKKNLFIGITNEDVHELKVDHLDHNLSFGSEDSMRVTCDMRKKEDIKVLVTVGERECLELSNSSDDGCLFILFLETQGFIQFLLYDGKLDQKICCALVIDEKSRNLMRSIAFSIIERNFKGFYQKISEPLKTEDFR
ncbi:hypothetical protein M2277_001887 [Paenibacillus sp. LBL]|uniref:hypothetical protein n=1 Tax=Paenibacillus sp. LBL TaxID=2940563 RepID=UPI00247621F8|nr:hypothetical protein [Paenibacillus sp. LBL]MDH6671237.1 hypothetical protein [Paenibacillus sp. LBL]